MQGDDLCYGKFPLTTAASPRSLVLNEFSLPQMKHGADATIVGRKSVHLSVFCSTRNYVYVGY